MTRYVLATRNPHKVREVRRILQADGVHVELVGLDAFPNAPDVRETGVTFEENALLKAHAASSATNLPAIAEDSGLAVDVMAGMPGIFSARWSGGHGDDTANLQLLLSQLTDVDEPNRAAAFVCAAAMVRADGSEVVVRGELRGRLTREPRGANGFGYDPIFEPEGQARTTAEMSAEEKDAISHRGRAFRELATQLR